MSESGFCCRCGNETERKEQVGLITGWVCSVSCARQASLEFTRPPTPEMDKYKAALPFARVTQEFINWLSSEEQGSQQMQICRQLGPIPNNDWISIEESDAELLNRFFNIDQEKLEAEHKMLEETILEFQRRARSRRPA